MTTVKDIYQSRLRCNGLKPNAAPQPLPEAGARHELPLEAVGCRRLFGVDLGQPPAWPLLQDLWDGYMILRLRPQLRFTTAPRLSGLVSDRLPEVTQG